MTRAPDDEVLQRKADRACPTTSTSPPSELAANPLCGELFELKSHQAMDLRVVKKLAAKCLCQQGPPEWGFCRHAPPCWRILMAVDSVQRR